MEKTLHHSIVAYNDKKYIVCRINDDILFVIDNDDKDKVIYKRWFNKNGYIGKEKMEEGKRITTYLHNYLMDNYTKGHQITTDHKNRTVSIFYNPLHQKFA
jgi:hypothetical protein